MEKWGVLKLAQMIIYASRGRNSQSFWQAMSIECEARKCAIAGSIASLSNAEIGAKEPAKKRELWLRKVYIQNGEYSLQKLNNL